ncbi:SRPBCC family protein [Lentzea tibetensis]|uniref:SRPBCC family protein n=1 Tax=Lentzea tibetensis TaxID=2591470 RepID=A0A563F2P0_9PSEU|nr:SRPBCC family protein [Lentzea tibetensis]TWP54183.1 SRPBCC family protein [Lentzea tibetensis]
MRTDYVTGARVDVELELDVPAQRLWELITDVTRIGEWSPECVHADWLDTPGVGARFEARNEFPHGFVGHVICEVTEMTAPTRFAWTVGGKDVIDDDDHKTESLWYYELVPQGSKVLVRHGFEHGPGMTGLREHVEANPSRGTDILEGRLRELRENMTTTLRAMAASA